jgi:DNA end-binding protein Ku
LPKTSTVRKASAAKPRTSRVKVAPSTRERRKTSEPKSTHSSRAGGRSSTGRALWSGTLSFGLVTVPVDLLPALRTVRTPLRMISPEGHGLARQYVSDRGKPVESTQVERGYAVAKDRFVVLREEELKGLAPEKSQDINILRFVAAQAIPPMYFKHPYMLAPRGAQRAYRLLAHTMEELGKVALGSFVMRGTEYAIAVRAEGGLLRADVVRFAGELREPTLVPGLNAGHEPGKARVGAMKRALGGVKRKAFAPDQARDSYWQTVEKLAKTKARRHSDVVEPEVAQESEEPMADVIDLMDVLRRSLHEPKGKRASGRKR